ncbi:holo-[acyl-carrier-protein] synthase [Actinocorallia lasiicapitis]
MHDQARVRVGVDVVEVDRVARLLAEHPAGITDLFTAHEIAYCRRKKHHAASFAARFAAKEAVLKAFGTGLGRRQRWTDVEIVNQPLGKPSVRLHGETAARAGRDGLTGIDVSLSHTSGVALASVVTVWNDAHRNGEEDPCGSI